MAPQGSQAKARHLVKFSPLIAILIMSAKLTKLIVIFAGICGTGKTSAALGVKTLLGKKSSVAVHLIEGDDFHSPQNVDKMKSGVALDDADRMPWLDALNDALSRFINNSKETSVCLCCCSALKRVYRARLIDGLAAVDCDVLFVCFVASSLDVIERRVSERGESHFFAPSLVHSQLDAFEAIGDDDRSSYAGYAELDPTQLDARQVADAIVEEISGMVKV
jgi:gluconokinase